MRQQLKIKWEKKISLQTFQNRFILTKMPVKGLITVSQKTCLLVNTAWFSCKNVTHIKNCIDLFILELFPPSLKIGGEGRIGYLTECFSCE